MKNLTFLFILVLLAVCYLSSCSRQYYAPGLYQNDIQLMMKPQSQDSAKRKIYISGALAEQLGASGQGDATSGVLNVYQSHTFKNINLSYGAIAYAGKYSRNETISSSNGNGSTTTDDIHISKGFTGYGFNGSISFYFSNEVCDFRILGADLIYTKESGDYLAFRRSVYGLPDIQSSPRSEMLSYGIFTEYVFHPKTDLNVGFKIFLNKVTGQINRDLDDHGSGFNTTGGTLFAEFNHINVHSTLAFSSRRYLAGFGLGFQIGAGYSF